MWVVFKLLRRGSQTILPQSTFPNRQCAVPETAVVTTSERCTLADATAGAIPAVNNSVVAETPYAIPNAPSTN